MIMGLEEKLRQLGLLSLEKTQGGSYQRYKYLIRGMMREPDSSHYSPGMGQEKWTHNEIHTFYLSTRKPLRPGGLYLLFPIDEV